MKKNLGFFSSEKSLEPAEHEIEIQGAEVLETNYIPAVPADIFKIIFQALTLKDLLSCKLVAKPWLALANFVFENHIGWLSKIHPDYPLENPNSCQEAFTVYKAAKQQIAFLRTNLSTFGGPASDVDIFERALRDGNIAVAADLIYNKKVVVNAKFPSVYGTSASYCPLEIAYKCKFEKLVELLLKSGASINVLHGPNVYLNPSRAFNNKSFAPGKGDIIYTMLCLVFLESHVKEGELDSAGKALNLNLPYLNRAYIESYWDQLKSTKRGLTVTFADASLDAFDTWLQQAFKEVEPCINVDRSTAYNTM